MKNLFFLVLLVGLVSCSKLKPSGDIETKDVNVSDFTKIELKGNFKVFYVYDSINYVSAETYHNIFENLKIDVKNKTLRISEKRKTQGVDVYNITLFSKNALEAVNISDSIDMTVSSQMSLPNFELKVNDNAKFSGSILTNKANITMDKKAKANIQGRTIDGNIAIKDTASIIAPFWTVDQLTINAKNGVYSELSVDKDLSGNLTNTSKLVFYGSPQKKIKVVDQAVLEQKDKP